MTPMAHCELSGQYRMMTNPKITVIIPSKRIHPAPGRERNLKKATIRSRPSAKKMAASTNVRACKLRSGLNARVDTPDDVGNPNQQSQDKGARALGCKGIRQVSQPSEDGDPRHEDGHASTRGLR